MRLLSVNYPKSIEDDKKMDNLLQVYKERQAPKIIATNEAIKLPELDTDVSSTLAPYAVQHRMLMDRNILLFKMEKGVFFGKFLGTFITSFFYIMLWGGIGRKPASF